MVSARRSACGDAEARDAPSRDSALSVFEDSVFEDSALEDLAFEDLALGDVAPAALGPEDLPFEASGEPAPLESVLVASASRIRPPARPGASPA
jgi:hypothetical protein